MHPAPRLPSPDVPRSSAVVLLTCPDQRGIVAAVADVLYRLGANIVDVDQHADLDDGTFFQRVAFEFDGPGLADDEILDGFLPSVERFNMNIRLHRPVQRQRLAVLASQQPHCLVDLLARHRVGELDGDIVLVASNHSDHADICEFFGVPYHHLPITPEGKASQEAALLAVLEEANVQLVVLARYMQILSRDVTERYRDRIINIHHSLLPAFVGARPYHRAHERGVKIIGATAHYATADLDEGPIIVQDVAPVSHRDSVEDLMARGRDLEAHVLARAVKLHLAARVIVHGNRAVVFA